MTTRIILHAILFFILSQSIFGQCESKKSSIFYDADSTRLGMFFKTGDEIDSTFYWDLEQNKIKVSFEVPEYKYGIDTLNTFLLNEFRARLDFIEVNGAALVYILLEDSNIKEIRIGKRIGYNEKYDALILETLMLTNGNWIAPDVKKPLLFTYLFKMK